MPTPGVSHGLLFILDRMAVLTVGVILRLGSVDSTLNDHACILVFVLFSTDSVV